MPLSPEQAMDRRALLGLCATLTAPRRKGTEDLTSLDLRDWDIDDEWPKTSVPTVKRHIERLLVRLNVRSRGAIARRTRLLVGEHRALKAGRGRGRGVAADDGGRRTLRRDGSGPGDGVPLSDGA
jgi:hypothetical protein